MQIFGVQFGAPYFCLGNTVVDSKPAYPEHTLFSKVGKRMVQSPATCQHASILHNLGVQVELRTGRLDDQDHEAYWTRNPYPKVRHICTNNIANILVLGPF